jgi:GNAT superfamily N-acetyltransferase
MSKIIPERHRRTYAPDGLLVLRGPGEDYSVGSHWIVGDEHGYAEILLIDDSKAYKENTLYIEHIIVKEPERGKGYGRTLYRLVEQMARNLGCTWIQIDSEQEAIVFWGKMGYTGIDAVYYHNKKAMVKKLE